MGDLSAGINTKVGAVVTAGRRFDALLLDRDGVLNEDRTDYVRTQADFTLIPGVLAALRDLAALGLRIFVTTNQSAIGRGWVKEEFVKSLHAELALDAAGAIEAFYVCPHAPEAGCNCRKPRPGLYERALAEHRLARPRVLVVGDARRDLEAAAAADLASVLVRTGKGAQEADLLGGLARAPLAVLPSIRELAPWLNEGR